VPSSDQKLEALCGSALLTHEALAVLALDRNFDVLWANEAAETITGRHLRPTPGQAPVSILEILHPDDLRVAEGAMATVDSHTETGQRAASKNASVVIRVRSGKGWTHLEIQGVWIERHGVPMLVIVCRDVSPRQRVVETLRLVAQVAPLADVMECLIPVFAHQVGPVEVTVVGNGPGPDVLFRSAEAGISGAGRPLHAQSGSGVVELDTSTPGWWSCALPFVDAGGQSGSDGYIVLEGCGLIPTPVWVQEVTRPLVDLVSLSVAQAEVRAELERRAVTDPLTDLLNRTGLEAAMAASNGRPRALMCLDLDGFKEVNDLHGHLIGDALLVSVAERIRSCVRREDVIGRFGGDEFIVLTLDTESTAIRGLAQRLIHHLSEPFQLDEHELLISASIGCAFAARNDDDALLIRRADELLYRAKNLGGHRVEMEPHSP
jgi:diguanylate cyclase (GGDEF)-like protein